MGNERITNDVLAERVAGLRKDVVEPLREDVARVEGKVDVVVERVSSLEQNWRLTARMIGAAIIGTGMAGGVVAFLRGVGLI